MHHRRASHFAGFDQTSEITIRAAFCPGTESQIFKSDVSVSTQRCTKCASDVVEGAAVLWSEPARIESLCPQRTRTL